MSEEKLASIAIAHIHLLNSWNYHAESEIYINDHDLSATTGKFKYENHSFEIFFPIKVGNYCFVIERYIPLEPLSKFWMISMFIEDRHYSFKKLYGEDIQDVEVEYIKFLWEEVIPLLFPEMKDFANRNLESMEWDVKPLNKEG